MPTHLAITVLNLLPWAECRSQLHSFCNEVKLPQDAKDFVNKLKLQLTDTATHLDKRYPKLTERNLVDILCNTHHYTSWANVFGPLSGLEPKLAHAIERYIMNTFGNGTGLGLYKQPDL